MNTQSILISATDLRRIRLLLSILPNDSKSPRLTAPLHEEISRATVVSALPPGTVGLDRTVTVEDLDTGEVDRFTLTLPEKAGTAGGRLSILAPLGTALLGYSEGDEFSWEMPGGLRRLRIVHVSSDAPAPHPLTMRAL